MREVSQAKNKELTETRQIKTLVGEPGKSLVARSLRVAERDMHSWYDGASILPVGILVSY